MLYSLELKKNNKLNTPLNYQLLIVNYQLFSVN